MMPASVRTEFLWRGLRITISALLVVFLVAPMLIVVVISFSSAQFLMFPPPSFSLQWYRKLFGDPAWIDSLTASIEIVVPTGILAMVLGTAAALGLARSEIPGKKIITGLLMAPIVVPVIIIAAAIFGAFRIWNLNGSLLGFILAHTVLTVPYVVSTVLASLQMVDERYENAALTLGAPPWAVFRRIVFPLILPGVLSGLLFAMVISFDELVVSLFIGSPTFRPVTVQMWSDVLGDVDPTIAAVGTLLFLFSLLVLLLEALMRHAGMSSPLMGQS
ncbi:MAG TPA: ABC transporter permease [Pseudolabrys sp.]|nr:ABC transporter permease [Pseudolabrys sp.]